MHIDGQVYEKNGGLKNSGLIFPGEIFPKLKMELIFFFIDPEYIPLSLKFLILQKTAHQADIEFLVFSQKKDE